jgi:DNA-directed RNA polymerase specialized sigma24 family protein
MSLWEDLGPDGSEGTIADGSGLNNRLLLTLSEIKPRGRASGLGDHQNPWHLMRMRLGYGKQPRRFGRVVQAAFAAFRGRPKETSVVESLSDEQLLLAYRGGDEEAATALFERYYQRLLGLIRRQSGWRLKQAEGSMDVAQSVLRSFFGQLRQQRIEVGEDQSLWPLLVTITLNKVRNRGKFWQRARRDPARIQPLDGDRDPLESGPSPSDVAALGDLVERLLEPFSDRRRRIIELILAGHPVRQIAADVGATERTVFNTRMAAAKILEQVLSEE